MQQQVFDVIGLTRGGGPNSQFGFLLDAFKYGPPAARAAWPSAGTGVDHAAGRRRTAIREVIAFPKAASGADPLTGAPTPITAEQRKEAGIDAKPPAPGTPQTGGQPAGHPGAKPTGTPATPAP